VLVGSVLGESVNRSCQLTCPFIQFVRRAPVCVGGARWGDCEDGERSERRATEMGDVRRGTSGLQEGRLADIALNIFRLLIHLELRLGDFGIFVFAIALRRGLRSLKILSALSLSPWEML
jgi:hypothetical protein